MKAGSQDRPAKAAVLLLAGFVAFYLSILSIAGATAERLASSVDARLSGQVTAVVWNRGLESTDAAAARAAELLAGQAGVRRVEVLDADGSDAAIAELISGHRLGVDQPRLISVNGNPASLPPISDLRKLLNANRLTASLADHRGTRGPLETWTVIAGSLGVAFGVILCGGLLSVCFRRGLSAAAPGIARFDLMIWLGADPAFIAAKIARRSGLIGLAGGVVATLCADLMVFAAMSFRPSLGIPTLFQPQFADGIWTVLWPIVVGLLAATGGGLGAWRAIVRQERTL